MKKYKAVIMDYDLTIGDTADLIEACLYENAKRQGYELDRSILRNGIGMTAADIYRTAGISDEAALDKLQVCYEEYSDGIMKEQSGFFPFVRRSLEALCERGVILAVLSLKTSSQICRPLERHGLDKFIRCVVGPDEVTHGKPDPEGLFLLADKLGLALDDIFYVGDSFTDQRTAEAAGVDFGAVCTGFYTAGDFEDKKNAGIFLDFGEMSRKLCAVIDGQDQ